MRVSQRVKVTENIDYRDIYQEVIMNHLNNLLIEGVLVVEPEIVAVAKESNNKLVVYNIDQRLAIPYFFIGILRLFIRGVSKQDQEFILIGI